MNNKPYENLNILITALNFPDRYYPYIAPWSKLQADSIYNVGINVEVIAPRPYTIPIKGFPYNNFSNLPLKEKSDLGYTIHYPKFFYLVPKKLLFGITGDVYSKMVGNYILKNVNMNAIDIVHSRFVYLDGYGTLNVCKKSNIPLIVDIHGSGVLGEALDERIRRRKEIKTLNYASKILCVAKWQIEAGIKRGIPEDKLEYVPLGVDINKFNLENKKSLKFKYNIKENIKIILYVGQLVKSKGLEYLLSAIPKIVKTHKGVLFVIIGSGPNKSNLLNMCYEKKIVEFVNFKGGVPQGETLWEYYSMADIFILPSLSEGQPMVIYEAMASENAIIGTDIAGIPHQIKDNVTGFVIPPKDSGAICDKISYLLDNPEVCIQMGKSSRKRVIEEGWTWEHYAKRVSRIYAELM